MSPRKKASSLTNLAKKRIGKSTQNKKVDTDKSTKPEDQVAKLMEEIDNTLKTNKKEDIVELDVNDRKNIEWLQEQSVKLYEENNKLKEELEEFKKKYTKVVDGIKNDNSRSLEQKNLLDLYMEFQNNLIGKNPQRTKYTQINLTSLMQKLEQRFPFLVEHRFI